jgi:hydrogenase maturation protease
MNAPNWMIIGVGNESRGDDAAGIWAARRLEELKLPGVKCLAAPTDALGLMEDWPACAAVVIVDAASSGAPAGTIHRIDAVAAPLPGHLRPVSSHGFGVMEVVELARALGKFPGRLLVYGIEGTCFEEGAAPTSDCRRAIDDVVEEIRQKVG